MESNNNDNNIVICTLRKLPWLITKIGEIYLNEWAFYFAEEYNIYNNSQITSLIYKNYMDCIYVMINKSYDFIGTCMVLEKDIYTKQNFFPIISFLHIDDKINNEDVDYYSKILINHFDIDDLYMWCYKELEINEYLKLGFKEFKEYIYNNKPMYILKKSEFVIR